MKTIIRQATVPYSTQQMFDLINDIKRYPEFIPHCTQALVLKAASNVMEAKLSFRKGILHQSFTTANTLITPTQIRMQLVDGPFQSLQGAWELEPCAVGVADMGSQSGCRIGLTLAFTFKNALLDMSLGPFFHQMSSQLVSCFCHRAKVIYGT